MCRRRNAVNSQQGTRGAKAEEGNSISDEAVYDTLSGASEFNVIAAYSRADNCRPHILLNHHVYDNMLEFWELRPSDPQPTLRVSVSVSESLYRSLKLGIPPRNETTILSAVADTACQFCLAGINILPLLGLDKSNLVKCSMKMNSANNTGIEILGALPLEITGLRVSDFITVQLNTRLCVKFQSSNRSFRSCTTSLKILIF